MKTTIFTSVFIAVSILSLTEINAQDYAGQEDTLQNGLTLSIDVKSGHSNLRDATVKIYHHNKFIAAMNNKLQPKITVILEKETYYVLEINKPGYISKCLLISTVLPSTMYRNDNTVYEHAVSISLDKASKGSNPTPLIGILYYDPKQDIYIGSPIRNEAPDKKSIITQLENWLGS